MAEEVRPDAPAAAEPEELLLAAEAAEQANDLDAAERHWQTFRQICPERIEGYVRPAAAALRQWRYADADRLLAEGEAHATDTLRILVERAFISFYADDHEEALRRWFIFAVRYPWHSAGWVGISRSLVKLGNLELAAQMLGIGAGRCPDNHDIAVGAAELAAARQDWRGALQLWRAIERQYPQVKIDQQLGEALWHVQMEQDATDAAASPVAAAAPPLDVGRVEDAATRALLLRFESLGQNCEFGLVQRRFGAEPLGLLRWNNTPPETLLKLLEARFAGLGDPESTMLRSDASGEYYVEDRRYGLHLHTFIKTHQTDAASLLTKQCRHLRRLAEMTVETLTAGEKILVYKTDRADWRDFVGPLHAALRRLGPCTLLTVHLHEADNPPGSVRVGGEGLLHGFLDRLNPPLDGPRRGHWDIPFDLWIELCTRTVALLAAPAALPPAPARTLLVVVPRPAPEPEPAPETEQRSSGEVWDLLRTPAPRPPRRRPSRGLLGRLFARD